MRELSKIIAVEKYKLLDNIYEEQNFKLKTRIKDTQAVIDPKLVVAEESKEVLSRLDQALKEMQVSFEEAKVKNASEFDELRSEIMSKNERRFDELKNLILQAKSSHAKD
jgi:hypothetical protein